MALRLLILISDDSAISLLPCCQRYAFDATLPSLSRYCFSLRHIATAPPFFRYADFHIAPPRLLRQRLFSPARHALLLLLRQRRRHVAAAYATPLLCYADTPLIDFRRLPFQRHFIAMPPRQRYATLWRCARRWLRMLLRRGLLICCCCRCYYAAMPRDTSADSAARCCYADAARLSF